MDVSHGRRWGTWVCWLFLITATLLQAADVVKKPSVVRVTITKNDKSTVSGELIESSPAGVTVNPLKGDQALVPWSQIKTVSNGLTHQKIVDEWKTTKTELLCDTCHGDGTEKCETCHGSGVDPANAKPCEKCHGSGDLGKCLKCKEGRVPCPATCLKASMFEKLPAESDGHKHKTFKNPKGGSQWWTEGHIGELVVVENGVWVNKGKCPTCVGKGEIICPTCHGTAERECPTCHGAGAAGPACPAACRAGEVDCKVCHGTGLKTAETPPAG